VVDVELDVEDVEDEPPPTDVGADVGVDVEVDVEDGVATLVEVTEGPTTVEVELPTEVVVDARTELEVAEPAGMLVVAKVLVAPPAVLLTTVDEELVEVCAPAPADTKPTVTRERERAKTQFCDQ
jgi:hypothetical protein